MNLYGEYKLSWTKLTQHALKFDKSVAEIYNHRVNLLHVSSLYLLLSSVMEIYNHRVKLLSVNDVYGVMCIYGNQLMVFIYRNQ